MRVAIADDALVTREGIARLLAEAGHQVVGLARDAPESLRLVARTQPDVAIVDIRMPPAHTDEGIHAAREIRARHPHTTVLVLSSYAEPDYAARLLEDDRGGVGYLLKDRVADVAVLVDALERIAAGDTAIDGAIVKRLLARDPLATLTARQRGECHRTPARDPRTGSGGILQRRHRAQARRYRPHVETHVRQVLAKLDIAEVPGVNRRVLAVLAYLER
jgi:DNA-binding NarL/FixJ family response regulator